MGPKRARKDASIDHSMRADGARRDARDAYDARDAHDAHPDVFDGGSPSGGGVDPGRQRRRVALPPSAKSVDAAFCADFSTRRSLILGWTSSPSPIHTTSIGSLSLDDTLSRSKPRVPARILAGADPGCRTRRVPVSPARSVHRVARGDARLRFSTSGTVPTGGAGVAMLDLSFLGSIVVGVKMTLGTADAGAVAETWHSPSSRARTRAPGFYDHYVLVHARPVDPHDLRFACSLRPARAKCS